MPSKIKKFYAIPLEGRDEYSVYDKDDNFIGVVKNVEQVKELVQNKKQEKQREIVEFDKDGEVIEN